MKINYIIYCPAYSPNSGGYSALHYLSDALQKCGVNSVYITTNISNPKWYAQPLENILSWKNNLDVRHFFLKILIGIRSLIKIPTVTRKINRKIRRAYPNFVWRYLDKNNTVVIYAENEQGNPLEGKHIARWIMMNPKKELGYVKYSSDEHLFLYNDFYTVNEIFKGQIKGVLTSIDMTTHLQIYINRNLERNGGAYIIRKGINKPHNQHPKDFIRVDDLLVKLSDEEKAQYFNSIKTFISYDTSTFLAVQAALCGCEVIVIPDDSGEFSQENLKKTHRLHGIAYGHDDLTWAHDTLYLLMDSMQDLNTKYFETIKSFKDYWERYLCQLSIKTIN